MEILSGGGVNQVVKIGDTVRRPAGPWAPRVHALLRHLASTGFTGAPEVRSVAGGYEFLSYLPGDVSNYPLTPAAASSTALISAATLLRAYHDATVPFVRTAPRDGWQVPAAEPVEVLCHGDYGPHNCVLDGTTVTGLFDFDFAHPGPRLSDIAQAVYRWVPLTSSGSLPAQAARLRAFCDAYGLDPARRAALVDAVAASLHSLVGFMRARAAAGDKAFAGHMADGHHTLYLTDADYVLGHSDAYTSALAPD